MINCAHPEHIARGLSEGGANLGRIKGLRVNASKLSHAELDCCCSLDNGDPVALGGEVAELCRLLPDVRVLGGCCGTDYRHIAEIVRARPFGG